MSDSQKNAPDFWFVVGLTVLGLLLLTIVWDFGLRPWEALPL